jgi:hypothetical protein
MCPRTETIQGLDFSKWAKHLERRVKIEDIWNHPDQLWQLRISGFETFCFDIKLKLIQHGHDSDSYIAAAFAPILQTLNAMCQWSVPRDFRKSQKEVAGLVKFHSAKFAIRIQKARSLKVLNPVNQLDERLCTISSSLWDFLRFGPMKLGRISIDIKMSIWISSGLRSNLWPRV